MSQKKASFKIKQDGTINVKPTTQKTKGAIQYFFKGIKMGLEEAYIYKQINETNMIVAKTGKNQKHNFVKVEDQWLMEAHLSTNSLLYGTKFIWS
jgi:hypothetical protein